MKQQSVLVTSVDKLPAAHRNNREPYEYLKHTVLYNMGNGCQVCFYKIPPGRSNYPYHYHSSITEVFYIISCSGVLRTPDGEKEIRAGDVVVCPPHEKGAHKITNTSRTETLTCLDVDTACEADICFYPDSGKLAAHSLGHYIGFFKKEDAVYYYDGE